MAKLNEQKRKELVDNLISGCECWADDDREVLNAMTDEKLKALNGVVDKVTYAEAIANAAKQGYEDNTIKVEFDEEKKQFVGNRKEEKPTENKEEEKPNENKGEESKPMTYDEWMASAPPQVQEVVKNAQRKEQAEKDGYVEQIVANERNVLTKEQLQAMGTDQLKAIAAIAATEDKQTTPNYSGAATPPLTGNSDEDKMEPLVVPTMNYKDEAIEKALGRV